MTANLYAGDTTDIRTGTRVGTITIKVPRFLLSGSQEIAMSMTGAANTPLEGSALATQGAGCDGEGIYAEIIEVIEGRTWKDMIAIIIDGADEGIEAEANDDIELKVYGRYEDSAPILLTSDKYTVSGDAVTVNGDEVKAKATGTITVTLNNDNTEKVVSDTIKLTVAGATQE